MERIEVWQIPMKHKHSRMIKRISHYLFKGRETEGGVCSKARRIKVPHIDPKTIRTYFRVKTYGNSVMLLVSHKRINYRILQEQFTLLNFWLQLEQSQWQSAGHFLSLKSLLSLYTLPLKPNIYDVYIGDSKCELYVTRTLEFFAQNMWICCLTPSVYYL
jgi:hypothetical protein